MILRLTSSLQIKYSYLPFLQRVNHLALVLTAFSKMKISQPPMSLLRLLPLFLGLICLFSCTTKIDALRPVEKSLFVVFGRPGSGKTTVANKAFDVLSLEVEKSSQKLECVALDLDVCVTQLMRDNFGMGIYPTLEERKVFAEDACDYVEEHLAEFCEKENNPNSIAAIISFSFVNTDLRDVFNSRFPSAEWILIDTSEEECTKRINEREGHFYKGEVAADDKEGEASKEPSVKDDDDKDNSDWKFAPVTFPHVILDGLDSVEDNANQIVEKILKEIKSNVIDR